MVSKIKWSKCCNYEMKFDRCLKCKEIAKSLEEKDFLINKKRKE